MRNECPLPIDWLDYLRGSGPAGADAHLANCPSCREVVSNLKVEDLRDQSPRWLDGIPLAEGKAWVEGKPDEVVSGQIWLSSSSFDSSLVSYQGLDRLPFVVVNTTEVEDAPSRWLDVVPLWVDVENAGPTDVIIGSTYTDLGTSFRLLLNHQTTVAIDQLDGCIGAFTVDGEEVLRSIWAGTMNSLQFGGPFESPVDSRLHADGWIRGLVQQLGAYYAIWLEARASAEQIGRSNVATVVAFRLEKVTAWKPANLQLAADTGISSHKLRAVVDTAQIVLHGYLTYRLLQEQLRFVVERAEGIPQPIRIVVHSRRSSDAFASDPFVPVPHNEFVLAEGRAIFPDDVESMQLVLSGG
jgi:hypothetical protein